MMAALAFNGLKKNFTKAVVNTFLHMIDTYLKPPFQKLLLEIFCCQIVTLDLSQTSYSKSDKTQVFAYGVENIFSRYASTCLKFILQNMFLKRFGFQAAISDF